MTTTSLLSLDPTVSLEEPSPSTSVQTIALLQQVLHCHHALTPRKCWISSLPMCCGSRQLHLQSRASSSSWDSNRSKQQCMRETVCLNCHHSGAKHERRKSDRANQRKKPDRTKQDQLSGSIASDSTSTQHLLHFGTTSRSDCDCHFIFPLRENNLRE